MNESISEMFDRWAEEDKPWFDKNYCDDIVGKHQYLLRLKSSWTTLLQRKDPEKYKIKNSLFTELTLNQCMCLAYKKGLMHRNTSDYEQGYEAAMKDVAKKLGFNNEE